MYIVDKSIDRQINDCLYQFALELRKNETITLLGNDERPAEQPTDQQTDMNDHRELTQIKRVNIYIYRKKTSKYEVLKFVILRFTSSKIWKIWRL